MDQLEIVYEQYKNKNQNGNIQSVNLFIKGHT